MWLKHFGSIIFIILCFFMLSGCDLITNLFHTPQDLEFSIVTEKTTFEYDETIHVKLDITSEPERNINISWKINGDLPAFSITDPKDFSFSLTPEITTEYTLSATVSDGVDTILKEHNITVKQYALLGTWKTTNVSNPAYSSEKDIIAIMQLDHFELYYFDVGGTSLRTYSAKGRTEFPNEETWIKMTQEEYYDESTRTWLPWTYNDGNMWIKLFSTADKSFVAMQLDMNEPADTAEYTWIFNKIDDTTDSWYP